MVANLYYIFSREKISVNKVFAMKSWTNLAVLISMSSTGLFFFIFVLQRRYLNSIKKDYQPLIALQNELFLQ